MKGNYGYRKLIVWQNAYKLRRLVYETTRGFPQSEMRRVSQMRDAARSIKQNIQEGYGKSLGEYIHSLGISQGSLRELSGDVEDCFDDQLITEEEFEKFNELCGKTDYLLMRLIQALRKKQNLNKPSDIIYDIIKEGRRWQRKKDIFRHQKETKLWQKDSKKELNV